MSKIRFGIIIMVLVGLVGAVPALAQQDKLTPGEPVGGEVTNEAPEVVYSMDAPAGSVVAVQLIPDDVTADYDRPRITLQDVTGAELVTRDGFGRTTLFWQVPEDGTYTIVVSRADEMSVGAFTLVPDVLQVLAPGDLVEGRIESTERQYFVYEDAANFRLRVTREGGFAPEFSVNQIDTSITAGSLDRLAYIGGSFMSDGEFGVVPGGSQYVLAIEPALLDITFGTAFADYSLEIVPAE
ncbi:MAG: hypothetical protein ACLFTK_14990 [Anaerolineales bacterium]